MAKQEKNLEVTVKCDPNLDPKDDPNQGITRSGDIEKKKRGRKPKLATAMIALFVLFTGQQVVAKECYRECIPKTFDVRSVSLTNNAIAVLVLSDGVCDSSFKHVRVAFEVEPADAVIEVTPQGYPYEPYAYGYWDTPNGYHDPEQGHYVYNIIDGRGREVTGAGDETPEALVAMIRADQPITVTVVDVEEAGIWIYPNYDNWIVRWQEITTADDIPGACMGTSCGIYPNQWFCEQSCGEWLGDYSECPVAVEYELPADAIETPYTSEVEEDTRRTLETQD